MTRLALLAGSLLVLVSPAVSYAIKSVDAVDLPRTRAEHGY